jgi:hypothetical protein
MATISIAIENENVRNAVLDVLTDSLDSGAATGTGTIDILGAGDVILATYVLSDPSSAAATGSIAVFNTITTPSAALATGTGIKFQMKDSDGVVKLSGDVGATGAALNMTSVAFTIAAAPESITAFTLAIPVPAEES